MELTLNDGRRALIRPIEPADKPRLAALLGRLSPETVRRRFLTPKPELTADELRYLTEVDGRDHIALVAVAADDPGRILGVARSVRLAGRPDTAEMAVVVADTRQGAGLGGALADALADAARDAGIRRILGVMLGDNDAARELVLRIGRRLAGTEPAAVEDVLRHGVRELTAGRAA